MHNIREEDPNSEEGNEQSYDGDEGVEEEPPVPPSKVHEGPSGADVDDHGERDVDGKEERSHERHQMREDGNDDGNGNVKQSADDAESVLGEEGAEGRGGFGAGLGIVKNGLGLNRGEIATKPRMEDYVDDRNQLEEGKVDKQITTRNNDSGLRFNLADPETWDSHGALDAPVLHLTHLYYIRCENHDGQQDFDRVVDCSVW